MPGDRLPGSDELGGRRVTLGRHGIPIAKRGADPAQRGAQLVVAVLPGQALVHTVLSTDARLRSGAGGLGKQIQRSASSWIATGSAVRAQPESGLPGCQS